MINKKTRTFSIIMILIMIIGCFGLATTDVHAASTKTMGKPKIKIYKIDNASNQTKAYNYIEITNYDSYLPFVGKIEIYRKAGKGKWKRIASKSSLNLIEVGSNSYNFIWGYKDTITKGTKNVKYTYKVRWRGFNLKYNKKWSKYSTTKASTIGTKSFKVQLKNGRTGGIYRTDYVRYNGTYSKPTVNPPAVEGYYFVNYNTATPIRNIKANKVITANYSIKKYTVTFKNKINDSVIDTKTVNHGSTVAFPTAPTITGYQFTGWSHPTSTKITGNTTIWANYKNEHTVIFKNGVDNSTIQSISVTDGASVNVPTPPTIEGKKFKSWDNEQANTGKITNVKSDLTITANYVNMYKITCIDGVTNQVFKTISVEEGNSVSAPEYPNHYNDPENPWAFWAWSSYKVFDTPIYSNMTVTAQYEKRYIINWYDTYDNTLYYTQKVKEHYTGDVPNPYPSHTVNGTTYTSNAFVGLDDTSGDSWRNYKNVSEDKCDRPGARVISMYFIYPDTSHKIRIISSLNENDILKTFYVNHGGSGTSELNSFNPNIDGYIFAGYTYNGNPITSLENVTQDMDIVANYQTKQACTTFRVSYKLGNDATTEVESIDTGAIRYVGQTYNTPTLQTTITENGITYQFTKWSYVGCTLLSSETTLNNSYTINSNNCVLVAEYKQVE